MIFLKYTFTYHPLIRTKLFYSKEYSIKMCNTASLCQFISMRQISRHTLQRCKTHFISSLRVCISLTLKHSLSVDDVHGNAHCDLWSGVSHRKSRIIEYERVLLLLSYTSYLHYSDNNKGQVVFTRTMSSTVIHLATHMS